MKKLIKAIRDENRTIHERMFLLITAAALSVILIELIAGLIIGESAEDLMLLGIGFAVFVVLVTAGIKLKKIDLLSTVISVLVIVLLLPLVFFTGGGLDGGAPVWFVFSTLFVSMLVYGRKKYILLAAEGVVAVGCYIAAYFFPEAVIAHERFTAFTDSIVSVMIVSAVLTLMVGFEISVLRKEKERAEEKSRQIEELNRSQNSFFSSMSHEIRTPINTIIGLNEMILREDTSEEVADDARNIQAASKLLLSLINDILDMSKMESGKMEIVPVIYDVGKMLSEIAGMTWVRARDKGLEFKIDVDPTMPAQLLSDEVRIKQIIINLLGNAVKYTDAGSVSLSVHCRRTGTSKVLVTYSVEDTGIGIRKENIPYLFDAFRRVDEKKNRYIEGTGLGLAIVKQLVDLLGGEISVNSIYTQGSVFAVSIEQETVDDKVIGSFSIEDFRGNIHGARPGDVFEAPKANVLIVDDNSANLLVAEKLLRGTKVAVNTADSGEACLKLTVQKHYDAIFMDHLMPGMDGIECLHAIRAQSGGLCRETPVIALTANAGSEDQALYRREGFDGYLMKPVESAALEAALLSVLPSELVELKNGSAAKYSTNETVRETARKVPLLITTDSVSDLPKELTAQLGIPVLPYKVCTDTGEFDDGIEANGDVLIRCMQDEGFSVKSDCPGVAEYERFFAEQLSRAQHIIHIAMAKRSSGGFANASEAALAFYNVSVIDSGHLSSGMGLMAIAAKTRIDSESFTDPDELRDELEGMRDRIQTSFILENTEYLYRSGRLSERINKLCKAFMIHPVIVMKNSSMVVGRLYIGSLEKARRNYIRNILRSPETIDTSTLFITYVGMNSEETEQIKTEVANYVKFGKVYLQKASPAISANCGAGTFGLLFGRKQA